MNSKRTRISMILIEAVAIFCSVLLAFAADQWREDLNDRRKAESVMGLVKAELEANLQSLQSVVGTREGGLAAYNDALAELSETQELPNSLPQLQFPEITNIAYRIATDAGVIAEIDPTELLIIAQAYEAIQEVESNRSFLDNRNAQIRYEDDEQFLSGFIYYSNRALVSEPAAINAVGRALSVM